MANVRHISRFVFYKINLEDLSDQTKSVVSNQINEGVENIFVNEIEYNEIIDLLRNRHE